MRIDDELPTDGGLRELAPLQPAIDAGADRVHVLDVGPTELSQWSDPIYQSSRDLRLLRYLARYQAIHTHEVLLGDIKRCRKMNEEVRNGRDTMHREVDIMIHYPSRPLIGSILDFERTIWKANRERGLKDGANQRDSLLKLVT